MLDWHVAFSLVRWSTQTFVLSLVGNSRLLVTDRFNIIQQVCDIFFRHPYDALKSHFDRPNRSPRIAVGAMDKYEIVEVIGEGSFGRVFRGSRKSDGFPVALKLIPKMGHTDRELASLRSECKIQMSLSHPNIVR